jgi:hypothetical protein
LSLTPGTASSRLYPESIGDLALETQKNLCGVGQDNVLRPELLPYLKPGVHVHYEGSIDKSGGNADWDWWLYQDFSNEWVLLDVKGPGCIYNFVQHRYPTSEEPVFRFYFDNEPEPGFTIRHSEFGEIYPFVEPLASRYTGPVDAGRGPIRVVRSFVPMPFSKGCRVTSSVKLYGCDKARGEGGWGHIVYHTYDAFPDGAATFSAADNFDKLIGRWKNIGADPKAIPSDMAAEQTSVTIAPGCELPLLAHDKPGAVTAVLMRLDKPIAELDHLWIRMTWDGHAQPDVELPVPCLFANELMKNKTTYLMAGYQPEGICYNYFPMPYWSCARIELQNKGTKSISLPWVGIRTASRMPYPQESCAYFRAYYYDRKSTAGADSIIADIAGHGHIVSALITAHGSHDNEITCEGDVRVYIDGSLTPQVESDGSESYSCYGWGFPTPPETNPISGYDGMPNAPWSMNRHCIGDWYPFHQNIRFGIESGGCNDQYLEHSGSVFYYGLDDSSSVMTDEIDIGSNESRKQHSYSAAGAHYAHIEAAYEGDNDHVIIPDAGVYLASEIVFKVSVEPGNSGVVLRRRSDQQHGCQNASVWVNDEQVIERDWYYADKNPIKRWLDDEFAIPFRYTRGKSSLSVRIIPKAINGGITWNEFHYWVYSLL